MGPGDGSVVTPDFTMHVKAMGDCEISKVEVDVSPQVLHASAVTPPYDWDLTNIHGRQTIVVTATDSRGQSSSTTVTVTAPADGPPDDMSPAGCSVGGAASVDTAPAGFAQLLIPAAAAMVIRRRRRR